MDEPLLVHGLHQAAALIVAGHQLIRARPGSDDPGRWVYEFPTSARKDFEAYVDRRLRGNLNDLFHARKLLLRLSRNDSSVKSIDKWIRKGRVDGSDGTKEQPS